ncbi:TIGR00730 family Rossman fold protein [Pseudooceanicola sp. HF7]|uniref:LOG family protein n=1 Tax=Pseudooceanicola sp. HF7 TaxID=2721560 RepID=UPI001430D523|nr:TIGR00730 family Rossman fold protein [Pseudooceanicola sp. HF7]NIZ10652.1 TIGR00730 family Rossman fold protein [Pseudooceanicola sp. HF7]
MTKASICVYCGSRPGAKQAYAEQAKSLGAGLAGRGWRLVYGAGDVGLMGEVARAAQSAGAETFGVIPEHLVKWEVGKSDLTRYVVTETMHERKKVMFVNSDAVVVLPGGGGTLDEFFEVLTWRQLGLHAKPIVLINVEGYWDPLLTMLDHMVSQGFTDRAVIESITAVGDAEGALRALGSLLD